MSRSETPNIETYWVLTNQALTQVCLRVSAPVALSAGELALLLGQVFETVAPLRSSAAAPELYPIPEGGSGFAVNLEADGRLVVIVTPGSDTIYEINWEPPSRTEALQETPEFLEAERRAEHLIGLLAILIWRRVGGVVTDLQNQELDPVELEEFLDY